MWEDKCDLRIPGPSPVPPPILTGLSRPVFNHRGPVFHELLEKARARLQKVFQTQNEIMIITGSGTAAMEAAVANTVNPGEKVLVLVGGAFGERWAQLCQAYGAQVRTIAYPWGEGVDAGRVADVLAQEPDIKAVFATQNESSTGVLNDIKAIARARPRREVLLIVDAISSLGGVELQTDAWGVDVVVAASQKCLMMPPGLAFISLSPQAWQVVQENTSPRFYLDLRKYHQFAAKGETPFTPNVLLVRGLLEAIDLLETEGLPNAIARHRLMRDVLRAGIKALGLELLVREEFASPTVTAVRSSGFAVDRLRRLMRNSFGVEVGGGQGRLAGQIFRIGHMGYATPMDMIATLSSLELALKAMGEPVTLGKGVAAAQAHLLEALPVREE